MLSPQRPLVRLSASIASFAPRQKMPTSMAWTLLFGLLVSACSPRISIFLDLTPQRQKEVRSFLESMDGHTRVTTEFAREASSAHFIFSEFPAKKDSGFPLPPIEAQWRPELADFIHKKTQPWVLTAVTLAFDRRQKPPPPLPRTWKTWATSAQRARPFPNSQDRFLVQAQDRIERDFKVSSKKWLDLGNDWTSPSPQLLLISLRETFIKKSPEQIWRPIYLLDGPILTGIWIQAAKPVTEKEKPWLSALYSRRLQNQLIGQGWISPLKDGATPPSIREWRSLKKNLRFAWPRHSHGASE